MCEPIANIRAGVLDRYLPACTLSVGFVAPFQKMLEQSFEKALKRMLVAARHSLQFLRYFCAIKRRNLVGNAAQSLRLAEEPCVKIVILAHGKCLFRSRHSLR